MMIPALDLLDGEVVRLYQGDFSQKTVYSANPLALARAYEAQGAAWLHVVDLQGAQDPSRRQQALVAALVEAVNIPVQVGGGIRTTDDIAQLLATGVARVVVGSAAIHSPACAAEWLTRFGAEALVFALDVKLVAGVPYLLTHG